jgi:diadenylate cyclase
MLQAVNNLVAGIGFSDIVDILIITFIIYKLIGFVRSSRAEQLGKGLLFLVALSLISDWLHFYTVHWVISNVLNVGLIALIVVFQPELRRALEYIGRGRFGSRQFSMDRVRITENVDMIVRAIDYFSQKKEGALIVIERETALSDIAETGTILDCELSEATLENIFYKGAPLHDGAVILRSDRILAAACVLPLTENPNLSKDLGTRHRAGIGISEVSDAIVLIVSEETGIISMAMDGKLSRFLDLKTVEKTLLGYYLSKINRQSGDSFIPKLFTKVKNDEQKEND